TPRFCMSTDDSSVPDDTAKTAASLRIDRSARPPRRRGAALSWLVGLAVVAVAGGVAWTFLSRAGRLMGGVEVREGRAARASSVIGEERTTASGYVVARTRAAISPKYPGKLARLLVDVGDLVEKGQLLAEMDHVELDAALARSAAEVERARADADAAVKTASEREAAVAGSRRDLETTRAGLAEAEVRKAEAAREADRAKRLFEEGIITETERDRARSDSEARDAQQVRARAAVQSAEAECVRAEKDASAAAARAEAAKAGVASADAAHREAAARREDAFIRADFRGRVLRKEAEVGEVIAPASTGGGSTRGALLTLADFETLEMEVDVFERDVSLVVEGAPCRIVLDAYPKEPFAGKVRQVVPTADRQKATVQVKVAFDRPDPRVLPEMGGKAVFLAAGSKAAGEADRVTVPAAALTERGARAGVFLLVKESTETRVRFATVKTGESSGGRTAIVEGLSGGERVVVDPPAGLSDGDLVTVTAKP
ncbi:MAG TPA: efflux RND transporter periplasmic adaptor subunit, partial [Planctomycetota bacterium]|nr:efflux RND transporter periplasmic adaptor subunit [Planctomycetota bacterium]